MTVRSANSSAIQTYLAFFLSDRNLRAEAIRVMEPTPSEPQWGRGRLYVLVELMGESPLRTKILRQIHDKIQDTYYTAGGSVSTILEQAILEAHEILRLSNENAANTDLRAGILCVALVQKHLVIASAGPGLALIATERRLDQFPPDPGHFANRLGDDQEPHISFYRHQVKDGDVFFLGESDWILLTDVKTMGGAVANTNKENRFDVVDYLRRNSNNAEILGMLIVVEESQPASRRAISSSLPTSVGAAPPVRALPSPPGEATPSPAAAHTPVPVRGSGSPGREPLRSAARGEQGARRARSWWAWLLALLAGLATQAGSLWAATRRTLANILPERGGEPAPPPGWVGALPEVADAVDAPVRPSQPPFTPPGRTRGGKARLFILLALLIPLLAFATVGGIYLQQGASNQTEGIQLVEMAEQQLFRAQQALGLGDEGTARSALGEAQRYLNEAIALIGLTDRIRQLNSQIQSELQSLLQVRLLYSLDFPPIQFPADASPHRVVVFGQDVYVMDNGRQLVESFRMDPTRTLLQESRGAIIREGDVVQGVTVGRLVDISWQPRIPGYADIASLLILDRNNNVFRYNPVDETTHLPLAEQNRLLATSQLDSYNGRLYLVDEQANQIWRYAPAGSGYAQAPDAWFAPEVQSNLAGISAIAIDGDIWLLVEDGAILRYRQGQQSPFSLENTAGMGGRMVDMALSSRPDGRIYLADANANRILVFDKSGRYLEQLQAAEANALQGLRGLYLDESTGTLFILTQRSLYVHSLPE